MKKSILLATVGLAVAVSSSFGVGSIMLDNYNTYGPYVTYGPGGAGPVGTGLGAAWTAGIYYANGDVLSLVTPDPTGIADPGALYAGFLLVTGPGSTAAFDFGGTAGTFRATQTLPIAGNPGDTITAMVVAYDGPSYLLEVPTTL